MQIIDEQGRIFKKFNLLDLAVILFIILCATLLYIRIMRPEVINKKISDIYSRKDITVKIKFSQPSDVNIERYVYEGDIQRGVDGSHAKVEKIDVDYKLRYLGAFVKVYSLTLKMSVLTNDKGEYFFGPCPIKLGEPFKFYTSTVSMIGTIQEIEGVSLSAAPQAPYIEKQKEVIVEVESEKFWLAEYITIGDRERREGCYAQVIEKAYNKFEDNNFLVVKFMVRADIGSKQQLSFGNDIILMPGLLFLFQTDKYVFNGWIIKVEPKPVGEKDIKKNAVLVE